MITPQEMIEWINSIDTQSVYMTKAITDLIRAVQADAQFSPASATGTPSLIQQAEPADAQERGAINLRRLADEMRDALESYVEQDDVRNIMYSWTNTARQAIAAYDNAKKEPTND